MEGPFGAPKLLAQLSKRYFVRIVSVDITEETGQELKGLGVDAPAGDSILDLMDTDTPTTAPIAVEEAGSTAILKPPTSLLPIFNSTRQVTQQMPQPVTPFPRPVLSRIFLLQLRPWPLHLDKVLSPPLKALLCRRISVDGWYSILLKSLPSRPSS